MSEATLRAAWAGLDGQLALLQPLQFSATQWALLARLRACFHDRAAQAQLPIALARFRDDAWPAIYQEACRHQEVETASIEDGDTGDAMAGFARAFNADVDALLRVLLPAARYRKGHYAHGLFTVAAPYGLHTDHSAEDPAARGEPICIARIGTLATHYVGGDYRDQDAEATDLLRALRYWTPVDGQPPEDIFATLLARGTLQTIPLNHVVLMVAGNGGPDAQPTQHIAARPPEGGQHSAFFQRQYRFG